MFHTIRIKNKGIYLGRDCPAEGIVVSDFIITVLKSMGADVEIYDPEEEARLKKAKLEEEQAKKQEEAKEALTAPVDEKVQEVETENQEVVEDSQESAEEKALEAPVEMPVQQAEQEPLPPLNTGDEFIPIEDLPSEKMEIPSELLGKFEATKVEAPVLQQQQAENNKENIKEKKRFMAI